MIGSRRIVNIIVGTLFVLTLMVGSMVAAQQDYIDFESDQWVVANGEVKEYLGRKSLVGMAYLKDVEFENGIIEVDIAVTRSRSYPGINFRIQSIRDFERFYVRSHRTNGLFADALQYTPSINGVAGWQLYSGDGFTAAADVPYDQWVTIRIEISGTQARVFIGDSEEPALEIDQLKHGISRGSIGLNGPPDGTAYFSNFRFESRDDLVFDSPPVKTYPRGIIRDWELSQGFITAQIDNELTPAEQGLEIKWQKVQSEPDGLVDIARFVQPRGMAGDWVWARTMLHSDSGDTRTFYFGYSDYGTVFLNSRPIFFGNAAYTSRSPGFSGIIGYNDALFLPLDPGENELLILVGETFGGWGLMGRDGDDLFAHETVTKKWELARQISYPESVVYDPETDLLYVSIFFNYGREAIARVRLDGTVENAAWVTGLNRPTGMCLHDEKLFVVERGGVVEIDTKSGEISNRYPIPDPEFPNDITVDDDGNFYVSDNGASKIWKLAEGTFELWLAGGEVNNPNGMLIDGDRLIFGNSGDGCLKYADLETKAISTLVCVGEGSIMDGVTSDGSGNYIVSDFNGRVFRVTPTSEKTELLNYTASGTNFADLTYIPEKSLLIIPGLYSNLITAFKLTPSL